jgi:hypothetical protein
MVYPYLTKKLRFSSLINGVFIGVGIAFLLWGATDIAFPIAERMSVAVFGLLRIVLGIISLSVGIGVEAVQWAKIGSELSLIDLYEQVQSEPEQPKLQAEQLNQPIEQQTKLEETPLETPPAPSTPTAPAA